MIRLLCALVFLVLGSVGAYAQEKEEARQEQTDNSYYAFNLSFYHSEGVVEGEDYSFNHVGLELERHWSKNKLLLSGWSLGYRKEEFDKKHFGHFIYAGVFRRVDTFAGIYLKPGLKFEWGLPSDRLDHTVFHEGGSYTYVYLLRNSDLPSDINRGFFFWPVVDLKVGKTVSIFVFEAGARAGYPEIVREEYHIGEDGFEFEISKRRVLIPSLMATMGVRF